MISIEKTVQISLLLLFAALMWFVFIRSVPQKKGIGAITGKTFKPSEKYSRSMSGAGRDFRANSDMIIAEAYVFSIKVPDIDKEIRFTLNTVAAERFEIGQEVEITWEERGIPGLWLIRAGVDMQPVRSDKERFHKENVSK